MGGELDLQTLLREMRPEIRGRYAFCVLDEEACRVLPVRPLCTFQEDEGLTVILEQGWADKLGLTYTYVGTLITLNVLSSLNAVGFLARIANKLASEGISINAFSPVHHDHLFVRPEDTGRAMKLLAELSREAA